MSKGHQNDNRNTLEFFMWSWQQHFRLSVQTTAEALFNSLDKKLEPEVFLVGVLTKEREDRHPICVEPEDECWYEPRNFSDVEVFAESFATLDDENDIIHTHPYVQDKREQWIKHKALKDAIEKVLQRYGEHRGVTSFCSMPTLVEDYLVCCVLELNREAFESHYSLVTKKLKERYPVATSLLQSAIAEFLEACSKALTDPNAGEGLGVITRGADELVRAAGRRLMINPMWRVSGMPHHDLFDSCNAIASLRYEGKESVGRMFLVKPDHANVKVEVTFKNPVSLRRHRAARKMLEMSRGEMWLLSNGNRIYGLGKGVGTYDARAEDVFTINFIKHHKWELKHAGHELMTVIYGQPQLPAKLIDEKKFKSDLRRIFSGIRPDDVERLWSLAISAAEQEHGTILVVSNAAEEEAARLSKQSTVVEPFHVTQNEIPMLTAIDGAVLVEPSGRCHAVGVILDGLATDKGTPERGARYNSAIRYVETARERLQNECLAIVVSEDGTIDLVPDLMPVIKRSLIDEAVSKLRKIKESEDVDAKNYNRTIDWLEKHQFYLMPELFEEVKTIKNEMEARFEERGMRVIQRDFKLNPLIDNSFFIE
jgi:DNA integrity scanning protein DisA with diadenylate cyclase activity